MKHEPSFWWAWHTSWTEHPGVFPTRNHRSRQQPLKWRQNRRRWGTFRWRSTASPLHGCWGSLHRRSWARSRSGCSLVSPSSKASLRSDCSSPHQEWGRASLRWDCRSWWGTGKTQRIRHSFLTEVLRWRRRRRREEQGRQKEETSSLVLCRTAGLAGFYSLVHLFSPDILFKQPWEAWEDWGRV